MPELPPDKRRPLPEGLPAGSQSPSHGAYAELHCRTNYSFLEGASHPDELAQRAAELGYTALAITDRHSLSGVVRAHVAAKELGLKLLIGAEIAPEDAWPLVLLATDREAYARLSHLLTLGRRRVEKGSCQLFWQDLAARHEGLLALVLPPLLDSALPPPALPVAPLARYRELFGDRCYLLAELHRGPDDPGALAQWRQLARRAGVPLVAAGDVRYHHRSRGPLWDVLTAIRQGTTVADVGDARLANYQRHLRSIDELTEIYAAEPAALRRTLEVAARCRFSLEELRYEYPHELSPPGQSTAEYLAELTWAGAAARYPQGIPPRVRDLLEHELRLIGELRYEAYFLTVWDLVRFARGRGILCQGRGSAANSAVCFALGITSVDPERMDVLFERFISRERGEAPDIDVDFEHERREEVLQYIYEKYGRERAAMTAEVITYRPRSAVRDVGKALGLSLDLVDRLAKNLDHYREAPDLPQRCREAGLDPASPVGQRLAWLTQQILGFPRHLSQHVGGMVMTQRPIWELVPVENAAMPGRTVIAWDKDDLDALGILKVDCLALGMLTAIHRAFDMIERHTGRALTLAAVPAEDRAVYDMICQADTMGVFQIESRAQMSMLPRLRPRCFYDLVIEVAIVRPGPIQGDMVHPYLRRRNGEEPIEYPSPAIREVLKKTLGVPLFQEQAMRLAVVAAGFTPGEADQLRRAMGAWRRPGVIDQFRRRLIEGMTSRGLTEEFALRVFEQIRGFGEYGFPESHAASFALLVYVSAWLKRHQPAAFTAALINSQPMGFYAPAQLIRNAREHGVGILPCDVNHSDWDCTLEPVHQDETFPLPDPPTSPGAIRLGLRMISGLSERDAQQLVAARQSTMFVSMADLAARSGLGHAVLERLAKADACGSLQLDRRRALWDALGETPWQGARDAPGQAWLPFAGELEPETLADAPLPPLSEWEQVLADYRTQKHSLRRHPLAFVRSQLQELRALPAQQLAQWPADRQVRVAGIVLMRQRPSTAKGIIFMTLEDETGVANLIVRPDVWERFRPAAKLATILLAHGRLQRQHGVIHVLVNKLEDLAPLLRGLRSEARDFR